MSKEQIKLMHNLVSFVRNLKSELQALTWYCSQDMLKYSNACVQSVPQKYLCRWSPRAERSPLAQITLSAESASIPKIGMLFALVSFSTKSTDNQHNIYNNSDWLTIKADFHKGSFSILAMFLAALTALCLPLPLVSDCHFRIWTQRMTFEPWDPSDIWSEWCQDKN